MKINDLNFEQISQAEITYGLDVKEGKMRGSRKVTIVLKDGELITGKMKDLMAHAKALKKDNPNSLFLIAASKKISKALSKGDQNVIDADLNRFEKVRLKAGQFVGNILHASHAKVAKELAEPISSGIPLDIAQEFELLVKSKTTDRFLKNYIKEKKIGSDEVKINKSPVFDKIHMESLTDLLKAESHEAKASLLYLGKKNPALVLLALEVGGVPLNLFRLEREMAERSLGVPLSPLPPRASLEVNQDPAVSGMSLAQVLQRFDLLKEQELAPKLDHDYMTELFQKELTKEEKLENCLNDMMMKLGVNPTHLPQEEIENLKVLFLLARNVDGELNTSLCVPSALGTLIGIVKSYSSHFVDASLNGQKEFLDQFNFVDPEQLSHLTPGYFALADLIYLQNILEPNSIFSKVIVEEIHEKLKDPSINQFKLICDELQNPDSLSEEEILKKSYLVMAILNFLSKNLPVDDEHEGIWGELYSDYEKVLNIKTTSTNQTVQEKISLAFKDYSSLIEDGFVAYKLKVDGGSYESVTHLLYGRSEEEIEKIKSQNRVNVAQTLLEFSDHVKRGNPITLKMLRKLHSTNNAGIVPRYISHLRKKESEWLDFGKRVGVMPRDVKPMVQEVLDKANHLMKTPPRSKLLYSIQVAKLHNDILDIHPFLDRNGSTALLFMELLMSVPWRLHAPAGEGQKL